YQISGSLDLSRVAGRPSAIAATQQDPVHYYQRPGAGVSYDSTRTSLAGDAEELKFGKVGGGITRFETSYQRRSQGFEVNDLGFLLQADQQSWNTWFAFQSRHPSSFYQTAFWNFNWWQFWTAAGTAVERAANTNVHAQLNNRWWVHGGITDPTPPLATHYTFAHLNQKEVSLTGRVDYTLSTTLTLQLYAQPFVSKGTFSDVRELADPNAAAFDDRYQPYPAASDGF